MEHICIFPNLIRPMVFPDVQLEPISLMLSFF